MFLAVKSVVLMIVGFVILIKGADFFVDGASGIAAKFKIPQIVIGLTIVAFGTSAPEAAISISAALRGTTGIAIGNILGSNLMNILLILGIASVIVPLNIKKSSIKFDIPFNFVITVILVVLGMAFHSLNRIAGVIFWALLIFFIVHLLRGIKNGDGGDEEEVSVMQKNAFLLIIYIIGGLAAVVIGSNLAVDNAKIIASMLGMDDRLIGLTIVAFGTSLPELMTSVIAARKGNADIAVGNILGSNVFNILFVLGTVALISPIEFSISFVVDGIINIATVILLYILSKDDDRLSRRDGIIFIAAYAAYFVYLLI